jgi:putative phosphoesterase
MKIGVISDTHIPERALDIPKEVYEAFKDVDLILHAGDFTSLDILNTLNKIRPVTAVYGNMDGFALTSKLKEKEIVEVGKFKIGLIHGKGHPKNLINFVKGAFREKLDIIIFGHSHTAFNERQDGILFFNPGSPTDTIFAPYRSYGMLEINDEIKSAIVRI